METIKFTKAELNHLVTLIADNERDGTYYGNRKQYWKRSFELKQKLLLSCRQTQLKSRQQTLTKL